MSAGTDSDLVKAWSDRLENDLDNYDTLRLSCCFGVGKLRRKFSRSTARCTREVGGTTCGVVRPWAEASKDERGDCCIACQAVLLVTPEDVEADIATMARRGPLFNKELQTVLIREYTTESTVVSEQLKVLEGSGLYGKWPLSVLRLAYPDGDEQLTAASGGVMLHHLLLLQYMLHIDPEASRASVAAAHTVAFKKLSVTDDKRPPADRAKQFRVDLGKLAFDALYDRSPFGAVTSRHRAELQRCLTELQDCVLAAPDADAVAIAISRFLESTPTLYKGVLSAAFLRSSPAARAFTDGSGVTRLVATPVELVCELITDSVLVLPAWNGELPLW